MVEKPHKILVDGVFILINESCHKVPGGRKKNISLATPTNPSDHTHSRYVPCVVFDSELSVSLQGLVLGVLLPARVVLVFAILLIHSM